MLKVLLADDELFFRESLRKTISWEKHGMEVCAEAENGEKALEAVRQTEPDIILADINMPKMDGLEFIRKVTGMEKKVKIVIISGYDNFEYAKQAIQLGVRYYLLKPVDEAELIEVLDKLYEEIKEERLLEEERQKDQRELAKSRRVVKSYYLKNVLLQEERDGENMRRLRNELGSVKMFTVFIGRMRADGANALKQYIECSSGPYSDADGHRLDFFADDKDNLVFLLSGNTEQGNSAIVYELIRKWSLFLEHSGLDSAAFGIGRTYEDCEKIILSYQEALKVVPFDITGGCRTALYDGRTIESRVYFSKEQKIGLKKALKQHDYEEIKRVIDDTFESFSKENLPTGAVKILSIEILFPCVEKIYREKMSVAEKVENEKVFDNIDKIKSFPELKNYILKIYKGECGQRESLYHDPAMPEKIREIVEYIEEHYVDEDLSVGKLSQIFYLNYNYMCVLFKKHIGITINDFILEVRMQKALSLINESSSQTVQEIADHVGFSSVNYFSKCFKRKFGVPPREYISSIL